MREILIRVIIDGDKIATAIKTKALPKNSLADQLLILGILENLKTLIKDRIKLLEKRDG